VPVLLASIPGSIGMADAFCAVAELANPVNRQAIALGADQAQTALRGCVGMYRLQTSLNRLARLPSV
jgi:hypothetical protein